MTNARDELDAVVTLRDWLVPENVSCWAARHASLDAAIGACPFGHWVLAMAAARHEPARVVRAAARVLAECGVREAARDEPEVRQAMDLLEAWDGTRAARPWNVVPLLPKRARLSPREQAARGSVRFLADAARILVEQGAGGPVAELMAAASTSALVAAGAEHLYRTAGVSARIEALAASRAGLLDAPPVTATAELERVVLGLQRCASTARADLLDA